MEKSHRIFLRNLPTNVTQNDIEERFKNHGTISGIEIKEKANALGSENKFAFVNMTTTERKLNTCFQDLKNLVINGCKVHMEIAKESFLARLQREREESKTVPIPIQKIDEPRPTIKPIYIPIPEKPEIVRKATKKTFEIDFVEIPKPKIKEKLKPVIVEQEKIVPLSIEEQKKKNESDEKRLKSLMEKKMAFRKKEGLIREALNAVDQKPLGKKIVFTDDMDILKNNSAMNNKGQKRLFDDDDEDGDDILDNNEFKIRGNMNKKLQSLQANFGNDKRFTLDDRFVEDEDNVESQEVEPSSGLHEERDWQLDILQNVLGKPMKMNSGISETTEKRKKGMIRYDPMKNDHTVCEIPVKMNSSKKLNKAKQLVSEANDIDKDKAPELSKDTFYNVSENLVNTLKQDEQFSLLKTFGNEISSTDNHMEAEAQVKQGHQFNFRTKEPFKYDSSDNEGENEDEIPNVQKSEVKSDWNDSLFFSTDDIRFEDARKFFNKQSVANSEFSTLRRELKQIVRSKIQNNMRKKVTWKKRKVQKT